MTSLAHKRMRLDMSSTSMVGSHFMLKILENRDDKVIELSDERYEHDLTSPDEIDDIVDQVYFQDNTKAFKSILSLKKLILIIYPPGSGKTTMALLLQSYLSSSIVWSEKLTTFFENCELAKTCKADYNKFRKSGNVAYINFEVIRGHSRAEFEKSLIEIMLTCFEEHFSENILQKAEAMLTNTPGNVYVSLMLFVRELRRVDKTKTTYLLLDSCDTVYNTIVQLGAEAVDVCKEFTKFLKSAVPTGKSGVMLICFGVSPYFAHEFSKKAYIHDISRKNNELGRYFSYSAETVNKVIEKWELETSFDECLKIAQFQYDDRIFVNPAICVSFLQSLHLKEDCFQVDIVPRSLWLSSIFTLEDRDLLLDVLRGTCEKEFSMGVSIMSIIFQESSRKLFYPLFIFGGFISCKPCTDRKKYVLDVANETSRCLLEKSLNDIYVAVYKRGFKECSEIYEMIFANKWQQLCDAMTEMLSVTSTSTFNEEKDYNNYFFGLICPAKLRGFKVHDKVIVKNNVCLAGIFPDVTISGTQRIAAVWEIKCIKAQNLRKNLRKDITLSECYDGTDITDVHRKAVLKEIRNKLTNAKTQIAQYASSSVTVEMCDFLKCFIAIFYLNHIALYVMEYQFQNRDENICPELSKWTAHCSNGFFCKEDLMNLLE